MDYFRGEAATLLERSLAQAFPGLALPPVGATDLAVPPDPAMGDLAFPCFPLAKLVRRSPQAIAQALQEQIAAHSPAWLMGVEALRGYLNLRLRPETVAQQVLQSVAAAGPHYGASALGQGRTVVVEYSSPNIAKPFSIGHIRSTVIGHSLARIHQFLGYKVVRINHLGDWGTQFGKLLVAYKSWGHDRDGKPLEPTIERLLELYIRFHEEAESKPDLEDQARHWFRRLEQGDPEAVSLWQEFRAVSLQEFRRVYDQLGVGFDAYVGESFYSDQLEDVIRQAQAAGITQVSQGALIVPLDDVGLPPCLLQKSDGATLYATRDIAAAIYRFRTYHFDRMFYVVGAPQALHFQQIFAVLRKMGYDWVDRCRHVPFGVIRFGDQVVSTRRGNLVFLEDVLNRAVSLTSQIIAEKNPDLPNKEEVARQVGIGAVIFADLRHGRLNDVDFSWEDVLNFDGATGPYVQYTQARAASILRKSGLGRQDAGLTGAAGMAGTAGAAGIQPGGEEGGNGAALSTPAPVSVPQVRDADFSLLTGQEEFALLKTLGDFPAVIRQAAEQAEPSLVARYLLDLCHLFNSYYHAERVLGQPRDMEKARLALVAAVRQVIVNGLWLLGLEAPESM